jgi:hypothetical protein
MHSVATVFLRFFLLTFFSVTLYFLHTRLFKCQGILTDFVMKICNLQGGGRNTRQHLPTHRESSETPPCTEQGEYFKIGTGMEEVQ